MEHPKILYISCHGILEYDELRMFRDLGYPFHSIGSYLTPHAPRGSGRPPLEDCIEIEGAMETWMKVRQSNIDDGVGDNCIGKIFTNDFLDMFDIIIVMHIPDWILDNWKVFKGRNVIWRTIGQSIPHTEEKLQKCRKEGLKIVRYSPNERNIPGYIGEDALIRFGKYKEDYPDWRGDSDEIITLNQSMEQRGDFCNYSFFRNVTKEYPTKLYGHGNNDIDKSIRGGSIEGYSNLLNILSGGSVYFYTGTKPASYTLNFMEASMCAVPMVSIGRQLGMFEGISCYSEVPDIFDKYQCGRYTDDVDEMKKHLEDILTQRNLSNDLSSAIKDMAIELFDAKHIRVEWKGFLESL
jgi:hypothetical protein